MYVLQRHRDVAITNRAVLVSDFIKKKVPKTCKNTVCALCKLLTVPRKKYAGKMPQEPVARTSENSNWTKLLCFGFFFYRQPRGKPRGGSPEMSALPKQHYEAAAGGPAGTARTQAGTRPGWVLSQARPGGEPTPKARAPATHLQAKARPSRPQAPSSHRGRRGHPQPTEARLTLAPGAPRQQQAS